MNIDSAHLDHSHVQLIEMRLLHSIPGTLTQPLQYWTPAALHSGPSTASHGWEKRGRAVQCCAHPGGIWWNMVEYGGIWWNMVELSDFEHQKFHHQKSFTHTQKSLYLESTSCFFVDVQCATHPLNIYKTCDCMTQYLMDTVAVGCSIRMRVSPPKNNLYQLILPAYTYVYIGFPNYDNGSKDVGSVTCNFGCYSESM